MTSVPFVPTRVGPPRFGECIRRPRNSSGPAWGTDGPADQRVAWQSLHHNAANTGNHEVPIPTQLGPVLVEEADREGWLFGWGTGSGCCSERGEASGAWLLAPMSLGLLRRRRRSVS